MNGAPAREAKLLEVRELSVAFGARRVVDRVSFSLARGERLALVGESGSGKTVTALSMLRLLDGARLGGQIRFDGEDVLAMAPDPSDKWKPMPVLVTRAADMAQCRGMRMGYAPLLALLEPALAQGYKRLAVIGIPCQVYALRALEKELGFEKLYVIGTPCSDNTTTENFHQFLSLLSEDPAATSRLLRETIL